MASLKQFKCNSNRNRSRNRGVVHFLSNCCHPATKIVCSNTHFKAKNREITQKQGIYSKTHLKLGFLLLVPMSRLILGWNWDLAIGINETDLLILLLVAFKSQNRVKRNTHWKKKKKWTQSKIFNAYKYTFVPNSWYHGTQQVKMRLNEGK